MTAQDFRGIFHQLLEEDIVRCLAELKNMDLRQSLDVFYKSRLAKEVEDGSYGIDCMSPRWLAEDLIENESELLVATSRDARKPASAG